MEFGQRLKELRKNAGLSQKQLGQLVGVTKSVISFYELQDRSPSPLVLIKLSGIFHVTTDYLLGIDRRETIDTAGLSEKDVQMLQLLASHLREKNRLTALTD
ncbi:MAG: helix-turn-helix transcriptional regulator [Clostridia bacterium]|nr:helix-turn-helix transcriptional regulator [Clostridia bacterium]